jgi:(p)ppGpp synthase/HD superfamily hydrolase
MPVHSLYSPLIEQALRVAATAHHTQQRKGAGVPYVTHIAGVALILSRAGFCDDHLLAAAILHDVVEDTDVTLEQLVADFPQDVVDLVAALSETKRDTTGAKRTWEIRKQEHVEHVRSASLAARAITLADKLHNLETMLHDIQAERVRFESFGAPPERLLWYYEEMTRCAAGSDADLRSLADACEDAIERLRAIAALRSGSERLA